MRARVKSREGEKQDMAERAATSKAGMLSGLFQCVANQPAVVQRVCLALARGAEVPVIESIPCQLRDQSSGVRIL